MDTYLNYFHMFVSAIQPYWAELIGAFLMATMANLTIAKGAQKESFSFLSAAFYAIIIKDIVDIVLTTLPNIQPNLVFPPEILSYVKFAFISLISALLIVSALKNLRLYFSPFILVLMLTIILSGISIILPRYERFYYMSSYVSALYLTLSLFMVGISFYLNKMTRQNKAIRSIGNGLIVLSVCYAYQLFDLVANFQLIMLLCYTAAVVLSLGGQVQFLNVCISKLERQLQTEQKSKKEIWEFSPFPIVISRLRDDEILYMNPAAKDLLALDKEEYHNYPFSAYFIKKGKKDELLEAIRKTQVVRSFEAEVHHPNKNNDMWIDMTTRTTDMDEEIVLFTTFMDITEKKRTAKILEEQASTDPLTGLYNRRQFEILVYQALQSAKRYKTSYSVLMFDIDFFKKINDTYGHDSGDAVLKNLARVLKETLRKSDIIARYGGEEFIAFLPQTSPTEAVIAAEHVREAVAKMNTFVDGQNIRIAVSIGISDNQSFNLTTLIKQADGALYASKENGRNRTTLYSDLHRLKREVIYPDMPQKTSEDSGK